MRIMNKHIPINCLSSTCGPLCHGATHITIVCDRLYWVLDCNIFSHSKFNSICDYNVLNYGYEFS